EVLDRLDELVIKPVDGSGGKGIVVGPDASRAELDGLREALLDDPRGWIAQPVVQLSTIPTLVEDGFRPRHADLRPFAVNNGEDVWVLPGGLTRVALPEGQLVVNSSQGGGSKDTWVLGGTARKRRAAQGGSQAGTPNSEPRPTPLHTSPADADIKARHFQQQQQQQQD
ncbi:MAG: circularly permuted type 2 ATP-grasp protein, partial [Ancrocorticia sp.]